MRYLPFCAVCTSERGPFVQRPLGRGNALVTVCVECDVGAPKRRPGTARAYEVPSPEPLDLEAAREARRVGDGGPLSALYPRCKPGQS